MDEHANDLPEICPEPWEPDILEDYEFLDTDDERRTFMLYNGYDRDHEPKAKELFPGLLSPEERKRQKQERRKIKCKKIKKTVEVYGRKFAIVIGAIAALITIFCSLNSCGIL